MINIRNKIILIILLLILIFLVFGCTQPNNRDSNTNTCKKDAKVCDNGLYVYRIEPNCDFNVCVPCNCPVGGERNPGKDCPPKCYFLAYSKK
jgi:hypothetical protein